MPWWEVMEGGWAYRCHLGVDRVRVSLARTCVPEKENDYLACYMSWSSDSSCRCILTGYRNWIWSFKRWWMNQGWLLPQRDGERTLDDYYLNRNAERIWATSTSTVALRESWMSSTESLSGKYFRDRFNWTREGLWLKVPFCWLLEMTYNVEIDNFLWEHFLDFKYEEEL